MSQPIAPPTSAPSLFLLSPRLKRAESEAFARQFVDVLAAAPFASVLLRLERGQEGDAKAIFAPLITIAQKADCAAVVESDARLAARLGADGAQIDGAGEALDEALKSLKPERIVGAGGLRGRDDAMRAGETGVDYLMFGEPRADGFVPPLEATIERVSWWAEIFETPCVAYAQTLDAISRLAAAGADFVAVGDAIWSAPSASEAARAALAFCCKTARAEA